MPLFGLNGSSRKSRTTRPRTLAMFALPWSSGEMIAPGSTSNVSSSENSYCNDTVDRSRISWLIPAIRAVFLRLKLGFSLNRWEAVNTPSHFQRFPRMYGSRISSW